MKYTMDTDQCAAIIQMYIDNIEEITPSNACNLEDACRHYKYADLEYAIREAARANVKNWRYIEAILERRNLPENPNKGTRYDSCALQTPEAINEALTRKIKSRR